MPEYTLPCMLERDTVSLGRKIGQLLFPGAFIALSGDLGTGKTVFTRAIAAGMGIEESVQSPSYTLLREYDGGRLPLYHFDAYRTESPAEIVDIGYLDYCFSGGVVVMEWANKVESILPRERLDIKITGSGGHYRTMVFVPHGPAYGEILKETVI